jgi:hypothetical protein
MKEKIISYTNLVLTKKTSIIFILILTTTIVFDSTLVKFSSYSGLEFPTQLNIIIFIIFSSIFGITSATLIRSVRKVMSIGTYKSVGLPIGLRHFQGLIIITLTLTVAIILLIILQMMFNNNYSVILLRVQTYLSHISPLVFLAFLVFLFVSWLFLKRNYIVVLYAISFSLICASLVVSLIYLEYYHSRIVSTDVRPYSIVSYVANVPSPPGRESLSQLFDALSVSSFLLMWVATAILLAQYQYRIGRIKYFFLMSITLVYYIFPFQNYFGDIFFPMLLSSPVIFSLIYILIFSATKQAGAVLFSLSFWTASSLVYEERVSKSLLISSIGMAILFSSVELTPLQYSVYPPYGLVTEAFIPLGAYLLFVGIFISVKHVSVDAKLRKEFYKSAASQLALLRTLGVSQMEKELENRIKFLEERSGLSEATSDLHLEEEIKEEDVKKILRDVLNELYYSKTDKKETKKT